MIESAVVVFFCESPLNIIVQLVFEKQFFSTATCTSLSKSIHSIKIRSNFFLSMCFPSVVCVKKYTKERKREREI